LPGARAVLTRDRNRALRSSDAPGPPSLGLGKAKAGSLL
jgi:hypothetical protein